jgi:hypothetical protein
MRALRCLGAHIGRATSLSPEALAKGDHGRRECTEDTRNIKYLPYHSIQYSPPPNSPFIFLIKMPIVPA